MAILTENRTRELAQLWYKVIDKIMADKGGVQPVLISITSYYSSDSRVSIECRVSIEFCIKYPDTNWAQFLGTHVWKSTDDQICERAARAAYEWCNQFNEKEKKEHIEKYANWSTKFETHDWCKRLNLKPATQELTMEIEKRKPKLCIDFDGVIHLYSQGWQGGEIYDDVHPEFFPWLEIAQEYFDIVVYSSRSKDPDKLSAMKKWFDRKAGDYIEKNLDLPIARKGFFVQFAHQKPAAFLTIDDRAICFEGTFKSLDPEKLLQFKPWNVK